MSGEMNSDEELQPQRFWSKPICSDVVFPNSVSEARDLCVGERNFLTGIKGSVALAVAGVALYFHHSDVETIDVVLSFAMVVMALMFPFVSLHSYVHSFNAWRDSQGAVHQPGTFTACVVLAAALVLVVNIREYIVWASE